LSRRLHAVVPAKINLGLEVVGRRPDGYHELVTILQTVSLFDRFEWTATGSEFEYEGPADVPVATDLVRRALAGAPDRENWTGRLRVVKRIPVAAGLGGGSADAALALRLAFLDADDGELEQRAAELGADVPFFIGGGTALATGTGTTLTRLATPRLWCVLVTPDVEIAEKTRALYDGLEPHDYSEGAIVRDIMATLAIGNSLILSPPNAFSRRLLRYPVIRYAYDRLGQAGASIISVSGAGPTLYALTESYAEAARIAGNLAGTAPDAGEIRVVRTVAEWGRTASIVAMAAAIRRG
ncbi:MAG: 4-(cytidine 5'-diphospho)-2-C-methyl-D-erythritol kinase, partial [Vicinamibacterales bacterium]